MRVLFVFVFIFFIFPSNQVFAQVPTDCVILRAMYGNCRTEGGKSVASYKFSGKSANETIEVGTSGTAYVVFKKPLPINPNQYGVITATTFPDHDCHSCSPLVGMAVFRKQGTQWQAENAEKEVSWIGQYGDFSGAVSYQSLGANKFSFRIDDAGMGQGYTVESFSLVGLKGNEWVWLTKENIYTAENNGGACTNNAKELREMYDNNPANKCWEYKSTARFVPKTGTVADIVVETTGTKFDDATNRVGPYRRRITYQFKDGAYQKTSDAAIR
jgi:hypothetical protein